MCDRLALLTLVALVSCQTSLAQLPTPELHGLSQFIFSVGTDSVVRGHGSNLDEPRGVLSGKDGVSGEPVQVSTSLLADDPQPNGEIRLRVAADATPGLVPLRVRGRFGVSNPINGLVVASPTQVINEDRSNVAAARVAEPGRVFDVKLLPAKRTYFRINLNKGDPLRLAAYVEPTVSDAIVDCTVIDPEGREVTKARSTRRWPAAVELVASSSGAYIVVLNDFLHRGGDLYRVAFEVGVGSAPQTPELELDRLMRPDVDAAASALVHDQLAKAYSFTSEAVPGGELPEPIPFSRQVDLSSGSAEVDFDAEAGQRLIIEARSYQLEQLTDPRIDLYQLKSESEPPARVAQNDDRPFIGSNDLRVRGFDPLLDWTASAAGRYRVRVSDNGSGSSAWGARSAIVSVVPYEPRFSLVAVPVFPHKDRNAARPFGARVTKGGRFGIRVLALRQPGFGSAVQVDAEGLPESLRSEPVILAPNMTESVLTVVADEDAAEWAGLIRIVGRPLNKDQQPIVDQQVEAHYAAVINGKTPHRNAIETALCNDLAVALTDEDLAPVTISLGEADPINVAQGSSVKVPVNVTRRAGGINDCTLRAQNLPPKVKVGDVKVPKDKSAVEFELKIPADLPPGPYSLWMQAETKIRWRRNPQSLTRAESYLAQLNTALETGTPSIEKAKLETAIKSQTAVVEQLKKQTAEKDVAVWVPTNPLRFSVIPAKSG